jgi:hypothetical protein
MSTQRKDEVQPSKKQTTMSDYFAEKEKHFLQDKQKSISNFESKIKDLENVKLGEQSKEIISCYLLMQQVYNRLANILDYIYGDKTVDEILNRQNEAFSKLQDFILKELLTQTIQQNLYDDIDKIEEL